VEQGIKGKIKLEKSCFLRYDKNMDKPKIYLETTIFNFPFVEDAPQYRADTLRLFSEIKAGKFRPFTSFTLLLQQSADLIS